MTPCEDEFIEYDFYVGKYDAANNIEPIYAPDFMDNFDNEMLFYSPGVADVGRYIVEFCSNVYGNEACVFFNV